MGAPVPSLAAAAAGTTIYVSGEIGQDCYDGLAPRPDDLCLPPGEPAVPGPFKTITKALTAIAQNPLIGSGPPYTVRIAARWHDGLATPYVYGESSGGANFSGESFPLLVPTRTLLKADAANSELTPTGGTIRVIIQGPLFSGTPVGDTLFFTAGGTDNFTSEGGLDGTEIAGYGIEVRRGLRSVFLEVNSTNPPRWAQIPPVPSPVATMSIRLESVWFSGHQTAYDLDAHLDDKALGNFTVTDCKFTTDTTVVVTSGGPLPHPFHTGQALIHLFSQGAAGPPASFAALRPQFVRNVLTVLPDSGSVLPDVKWGMVIDTNAYSDTTVTLSALTIDGVADPVLPQGIVVGIEFAANTGTTPGLDPRLTLTGSDIRNCAVFGGAVATGVFVTSYTALDISSNRFIGNGVRPGASFPGESTHFEYRGAGLHLVRRYVAPGPGITFSGASEFSGSIATNTFNGNRTGIAFLGGGGSGTSPTLRIAGNAISGQLLYPPGYAPGGPYINFSGGDGVGVIIGTDTPFSIAPFTGGIITAAVILEANRIFSNQRHGVWIAGWHPGSTVSPVLRNNRIYGNATVANPPLVPPPAVPPLLAGGPGDGVRIEVGPTMTTGTVAPTLVHETIANTAFGYGVNNVAGVASFISTPALWNSVVYFNAGLVTATGGPDLEGFSFPGPTTGGIVNYTDFCGFPWTNPPVACGGQTTPGTAGCLSAAPVFVLSTPTDFELTCLGTGTPCQCQQPPTGGGSACIDRAIGSPTAPFMPLTDAKGAPRTVNLTPTGGPDMGALEKQTCTP